MHENHPELFEAAKQFEKYDEKTGKRYTWSQHESLDEILKRKDEIKEKFSLNPSKDKKHKNLMQAILEDDDDENDACLICML